MRSKIQLKKHGNYCSRCIKYPDCFTQELNFEAVFKNQYLIKPEFSFFLVLFFYLFVLAFEGKRKKNEQKLQLFKKYFE